MDIANINALTRSGYSPGSRVAKSGVTRRADSEPVDTLAVARGAHQPVEYVVQGELLQKRRDASSGDASSNLLDAMRNMDRVLRQSASGSGTGATQSRDARRAIASYTAASTIPNTLTGSTAAAYIDYYV